MLLLPLQVKLFQFLASLWGEEALEEWINIAAYLPIGTMFHPGTVDENVKSWKMQLNHILSLKWFYCIDEFYRYE
jgi:hypothetical protein